jgi:hypothetical protein
MLWCAVCNGITRVATDRSAFGYKMLMKMGWSEGKGLGKNLDGLATNVKLKKQAHNSGLGAGADEASNSEWNATAESFNSLLQRLNSTYNTGLYVYSVLAHVHDSSNSCVQLSTTTSRKP